MSNKITNLSFNIAQKHSARAVRHNSCSENLLKIDKSNPVMELYFGKVARLNLQLSKILLHRDLYLTAILANNFKQVLLTSTS